MPQNALLIDDLISVCCLKDIETWRITSHFIIKNIAAKRYKVIVPDRERLVFQEASPLKFEVISESKYTNQFREQLLNRLPKDKRHQFGWYLQQFIKLSAIKEGDPNTVALIWDADTSPIKPIEFIAVDGKLQYYKGLEHHEPYFKTIEKILALKKIVDFSFIAQCFPLKVSWLNELCEEVENKFKMPWIDAMISQNDFNEGNGFSEYEILGTFITHRYLSEVNFIDRPWCRLGITLLHHPAFLNDKRAQQLSTSYDFISFEKWEKAKPYFLKVTIPYFFKISLPKIFKRIFS